MASVNIRRDVKDAFYRYKMPVLLAKVEGKGNGIKTVVPNMSDIAKALNRPPSYPTKFFGCELGAQVICDEKANRYIVNGAHEAYRLQDLLDGFITKFVLCPACKNPETELVIAKDGVIYTKCKACGEKKAISDQQHRLVPFIQKNAPARKKSSLGKIEESHVANGVEESHSINNYAMDFNDAREYEPEDEENWGEDMSEDAVAKRRTEQMGQMTRALRVNMGLEDDDEGEPDDENDPLDLFGEYLETNPSDEDIIKKVEELKLKPYKALVVLPQVVFAQSATIIEDLARKLSLIKKMSTNDKCQRGLLGGLERLVAIINKDLQKKLPLILQTLYQGDILDEEILLHWADHPSKKYVQDRQVAKSVRASAGPFIEWLKQASEQSSSGEEEVEE